MIDIIVTILSGCALVGGFLLEWRRMGAQSEIAELHQRLALLEAQQIDPERVAALEAVFERFRRNL